MAQTRTIQGVLHTLRLERLDIRDAAPLLSLPEVLRQRLLHKLRNTPFERLDLLQPLRCRWAPHGRSRLGMRRGRTERGRPPGGERGGVYRCGSFAWYAAYVIR
jgi:hypothetical protein